MEIDDVSFAVASGSAAILQYVRCPFHIFLHSFRHGLKSFMEINAL